MIKNLITVGGLAFGLFHPVGLLARPVPPAPAISDLLSAPVVLIGNAHDVSAVPEQSPKISATIDVKTVLKGPLLQGRIQIDGLIKPTNPDDSLVIQTLIPDHIYVFFLEPNVEGHFIGVNTHEFAIEIQHLPAAAIDGLEPEEALRSIGRENTQASKWCQLLVDLYDPARDRAYFLEKTADSNFVLRGYSVLALCAETDTNAVVYENAVRYLQTVAGLDDMWPLRRKIARSLKDVMMPRKLPGQILAQWLTNNVPELQEVALEVVRSRKDVTLASTVLTVMENSSDRTLQYECIKTLSAISGRSGPSYKTFMEDAESIMEQERRHISGSTSSPRIPSTE